MGAGHSFEGLVSAVAPRIRALDLYTQGSASVLGSGHPDTHKAA